MHTQRFIRMVGICRSSIGFVSFVQMYGPNVLFHAENGRIGFAKNSCDYGDLIGFIIGCVGV